MADHEHNQADDSAFKEVVADDAESELLAALAASASIVEVIRRYHKLHGATGGLVLGPRAEWEPIPIKHRVEDLSPDAGISNSLSAVDKEIRVGMYRDEDWSTATTRGLTADSWIYNDAVQPAPNMGETAPTTEEDLEEEK
jgi:hypothetical protein